MLFRTRSGRAAERATISNLLTRDAVRIGMSPRSRDEWIAELVDVLVGAWNLDGGGDILRAVLEREATLSTAIDGGTAIPHAKIDAVPRVALACGIAPAGVDFGAPDGGLVHVAFLLVSPRAATNAHVQALAAVSRVMIREDMPERLLEAKTPREVIRILKAEEKQP